MNEKIFNHEVTAGLLRGWLSSDGKHRQGIWFWNLNAHARESSFEEGKKAKFAGHNFLYVGNNEGYPITIEFEDKLAKHENQLVKLARELWNKQATQDTLNKYASDALPAILTAAFRSSWSINNISDLLLLDEAKRLDYLAHHFESTILLFRGWDFVFYQHSEAPLLICDAPFFDFRITGFSSSDMHGNVCSMPLGPFAILVGWKSDRPTSTIKTPVPQFGDKIDPVNLDLEFKLSSKSLPLKMAELINQQTLHRARGWVVASTENELLSHSQFLQPEELQKRVALDTAVVQGGNGQLLTRLPLV